MILLYRVLTTLLYPLLIILIFFRKIFNKEDSVRYKEKIFYNSFSVVRENKTKLFWFHAASIGELKSIIPIINDLNDNVENIQFLVTTVTLSSGRLAKDVFKDYNNVSHRFFPLDVFFLMEKFISLWKPDIIFIVETEIWPNLISIAKKNHIPLAIINARLTRKTFNRWNLFPNTAKKIFNSFDICLTANKETKEFLTRFKVKNVFFLGNIKLINKIDFKNLKTINENFLSENIVWCALSTHNTEEVFCLKTHVKLKEKIANLKTIIAPRHINRVSSIKKISERLGLKSQILNKNEKIAENSEIIIINSFGNINEFLKYTKSVFIGKSTIKKLEKVGGQNPIDAAKLGCRIYHGPYVYNFEDIYEILKENNVSQLVKTPSELAEYLSNDLKKEVEKNKDFSKTMDELGNKTFIETMKTINEFLPNEIIKT